MHYNPYIPNHKEFRVDLTRLVVQLHEHTNLEALSKVLKDIERLVTPSSSGIRAERLSAEERSLISDWIGVCIRGSNRILQIWLDSKAAERCEYVGVACEMLKRSVDWVLDYLPEDNTKREELFKSCLTIFHVNSNLAHKDSNDIRTIRECAEKVLNKYADKHTTEARACRSFISNCKEIERAAQINTILSRTSFRRSFRGEPLDLLALTALGLGLSNSPTRDRRITDFNPGNFVGAVTFGSHTFSVSMWGILAHQFGREGDATVTGGFALGNRIEDPWAKPATSRFTPCVGLSVVHTLWGSSIVYAKNVCDAADPTRPISTSILAKDMALQGRNNDQISFFGKDFQLAKLEGVNDLKIHGYHQSTASVPFSFKKGDRHQLGFIHIPRTAYIPDQVKLFDGALACPAEVLEILEVNSPAQTVICCRDGNILSAHLGAEGELSELERYKLTDSPLLAVSAFGPERLILADTAGKLIVVNRISKRVEFSAESKIVSPTHLAFHPGYPQIFAGANEDGMLVLSGFASYQGREITYEFGRLPLGGTPSHLSFNPDGRYLMVGCKSVRDLYTSLRQLTIVPT